MDTSSIYMQQAIYLCTIENTLVAGRCGCNLDIAIYCNVSFYSCAMVRVFICNLYFACGYLWYTYIQDIVPKAYHSHAVSVP